MFHQPIEKFAEAGESVTLAELVGAFSYALDITEGQPAGHSVRSCWIGSHVGRALGLSSGDLHDLYYTLLLKDLGCSSNAARICELYQADDLAFKQGFKTIGTGLAATLHFVASKTARNAPLHRRAAAVVNILKNGDAIAQDLIVSRCTRGADIAQSRRFSDAVCNSIYSLDEHWDGSGRPQRMSSDAIPLLSRVALLSQIVDVFHPRRPAGRHRRSQPPRGELAGPRCCCGIQASCRGRTFLAWTVIAVHRRAAHPACSRRAGAASR